MKLWSPGDDSHRRWHTCGARKLTEARNTYADDAGAKYVTAGERM
jgi:hypothetical protein